MYRLRAYRRINGCVDEITSFVCRYNEAMDFLKSAGYERMGDRWINNAYRVKDDVVEVYVVMDKIDELENSF